jgi:hypothetical protein
LTAGKLEAAQSLVGVNCWLKLKNSEKWFLDHFCLSKLKDSK